MISIDVPGFGRMKLEHLVLDYNGTIAFDGNLIDGVAEMLQELSSSLSIHVLTADTFGTVTETLAGTACTVVVLPQHEQDIGKRDYVSSIGPERTVSIGNGRNDSLMLNLSRLGIAVILEEGAAVNTIQSADVICTDILSALNLLKHPLRLVATLRT